MGAALIPLATGALGGMAGAAMLGPTIGSALAGVLPATASLPAATTTLGLAAEEAGLFGAGTIEAATPIETGLFGFSSGEIGKLAGGGIGSLGGSMVGRQLAKGMTDEAGPVSSPGMPSFPNSRGVTAPSFQFQTVGVQPSAIVGQTGKNDILDFLRRIQMGRA